MKRIWLITLSSAVVTATMALTMADASAARRGGINRGAHAGNLNRPVGAMHRPGVNRPGIAGRPGWAGNRVGWNGNRNYWDRPRLGLAAAGLAAGAAAASAAYYGDGDYSEGAYGPAGGDSADSGYYGYVSRDSYRHGYVPVTYFGPICDPRVDAFCQ